MSHARFSHCTSKAAVAALALALTLATSLTAHLAAQTHLHVLLKSIDFNCAPGRACEPGHMQTIDVDRGVIARDVPVRATWGLVSPPAVSADGRFLVWVGAHFPEPSVLQELAFVDLVTGNTGRAREVDHSRVFMDPLHLRAYLNTRRRDLQIVDPVQFVIVPTECGDALTDGGWELTTMSGDRRRAFMRCPIRPYSGVTYALDVSTGERIATIEDPATWQAADDTGTELFTLDYAPLGGARVRRIDVATADILVEREIGTASSGAIAYDGRHHRVLVFGSNELVALDATTLAETGRVVGPLLGSHVQVALDPDFPHLYVTWSRHEFSAGGFRTIAQQRHGDTLALIAESQLPSSGMPAGLAVAPRVAPPTAVAAVVTGRTVRVSWRPSQQVALRTGFQLEAGSGPGLSDIVIFQLAPTQEELVVSDVPAGTYYVRLSTMNGTGPGVASEEIIVRVD